MDALFLFDKRAAINWQLIASLPVGASFHRASDGTKTNARQQIESVTVDIPRFDYDPATGQSLGLLIEPQSTNALPYSTMTGDQGGYPDGWPSWYVNGGGGTPAASLYGNADGAVAWSFTANASRVYLAQSIPVSANTAYTFSFLVESNPDNLPNHRILTMVGAPTGSVYDQTYQNNVPKAGDRIFMTTTVGDTAGTILCRLGVGTDGTVTGTLVLSRPQMEAGTAKPSSYIPTTTSSATTRAADQLGLTVPASVSALRYVFDDWSVQDLAVTAGAMLVPTNLNRSHVRRIISR